MRPLLAALLTAPSLAILVAPGSPCASKCGNVLDKTSTDDIVCDDDAYGSGAGLVFKSCVECELGSSYVTESDEFTSGKETDLQWMIYNVRYATSYCFFGYPNGKEDDSPCITSTACGSFRDAITFGELASNVSSYDYCAEWQHNEVGKCLSCLRPEEKNILNNFFTVLNAACEQQPLAGKTVGIKGNVFSSDEVEMTDASAVPTLDPSYFDEGSFGLGAKVGVSLGALGFVLAVAGFLVVCLGKRRRRAYLRQMESTTAQKGWAGHAVRGHPSETPLSQKPLRGGWDDSPVSAATEKGAFPGRYFSPYSSQFSSPVSAVDAPAMRWPDLSSSPPHDREIGLALGGESPRPDPPEPVKGKGRAWDGVEVRGPGAGPSEPPVLAHPGYGRPSGSPPRRYSPTEEDMRGGNMI